MALDDTLILEYCDDLLVSC